MTAETKTTEATREARLRVYWRKSARYVLALVACALLLVGGYFAWQAWFGGDDDEAVVTAVAQRGNLEDTVTATGTLQP